MVVCSRSSRSRAGGASLVEIAQTGRDGQSLIADLRRTGGSGFGGKGSGGGLAFVLDRGTDRNGANSSGSRRGNITILDDRPGSFGTHGGHGVNRAHGEGGRPLSDGDGLGEGTRRRALLAVHRVGGCLGITAHDTASEVVKREGVVVAVQDLDDGGGIVGGKCGREAGRQEKEGLEDTHHCGDSESDLGRNEEINYLAGMDGEEDLLSGDEKVLLRKILRVDCGRPCYVLRT